MTSSLNNKPNLQKRLRPKEKVTSMDATYISRQISRRRGQLNGCNRYNQTNGCNLYIVTNISTTMTSRRRNLHHEVSPHPKPYYRHTGGTCTNNCDGIELPTRDDVKDNTCLNISKSNYVPKKGHPTTIGPTAKGGKTR